MPFSSYPVLVPVGARSSPRLCAPPTTLGRTRDLLQLQPPAQPGEKLIGDGAAPGGQLLGPELPRLRPADEGDHIPGLDIGAGR